MDFRLMVMLRSTTGPYGWPVIEVAYREMILSLHWGCIGDDSSGRVVGVSTWCIAHVWHTRINTSLGLVYTIFSGFPWYKNLYICILFSKSICSIKEHWWSLTLSWPDEVQKIFSITHELLNVKLIPHIIFMNFYTIDMTFTLFMFYLLYEMSNSSSSSTRLRSIFFYLCSPFF